MKEIINICDDGTLIIASNEFTCYRVIWTGDLDINVTGNAKKPH